MLSIIFHLALTVAILWYQRKTSFKSEPWHLAGLWYLVSVALSLIETTVQADTWFSGMFLQSLILALFYLPAVYVALRLAKRNRASLWRSVILFCVGAVISSVLAAMAFAYVPFIQHLSR